MAHGLFLATGTAPVVMEGNSIAITNGYPDATAVADTLADSTGFSEPILGMVSRNQSLFHMTEAATEK